MVRRFGKKLGMAVDLIDILLYGSLGAGLFLGVLYFIGKSILESGQLLAIGAFVVLAGGTAVVAVRDLVLRRPSLISKALLIVWAICTAIVVLLDALQV